MNFFRKMTAAACCMFGLTMLASHAEAAPNPNFHIYIAYGQSNMAGNGEINPAVDQATNPKNFLMLASHNANAASRTGSTTQSIKTGEWYPAIPPMFHAFEQLSPADYFGRAMVDSLPGVTVGIIPVAVGGVSIRAFLLDQYAAYFDGDGRSFKGWAGDYGGNPMGRILELGKKAKEVGVIKGVIFHQGESDGVDDNWRNRVYASYKTIINELDLDENEVPFVAGEMLQAQGACCGSKNGGIALLKNKFKKFGLASSAGLQGNGKDPYHFGRSGVIELGKRYASEMLKLIDKTIDPNAPAVDLVNPENSVVPDLPPEEYGPYYGEPMTIPGQIQAEDYNKGGAGKAYYDLDKGNSEGKYRKDDVDVKQPNKGMAVGSCRKGEWLKYTVKVEETGEYEISALIAGDNKTGGFILYMDDERIGDEMVNEGLGWDDNGYSMVSGGKATLKAGEHELKLEITNDWVDIDYVEFKKASAVVPESSSSAVVGGSSSSSELQSIRASLIATGSLNMDKAQYFDMQGNCISKSATKTQGVYMVRVPGGKTFMVRTEK
ncbi:MAG: carbohydrate-binding protein [Fibrobacter sp.]|nr:carbohydrate-binding protein [Fibrobacter sp.]